RLLAAVELRRVLLRHRHGARKCERLGGRAGRHRELDHEGVGIGRRDARNLLRLAVLECVDTDNGPEIRVDVAVANLRQIATLQRVFEVGRRDRALDRTRAVLDARPDLDRQCLAAVRDLWLTRRKVWRGLSLVSLPAVQRTLRW